MRLISAKTFTEDGTIRFKEFYRKDIPPYAILSHTWEEGQEVTFDDCKFSAAKDRKGYRKIENTCLLAASEDIDYIWIDTCCIDKSSSAELTEAINSMYQWYQQARVCYAYLSDLDAGGDLGDCRWFSRGWTLQELIAPKTVVFFDSSWKFLGHKTGLLQQLSAVTNIDADILSHQTPLSSACVAKRFSWAAKRTTTRDEDLAYCLLGIFNINMPMLYGEGRKAFTRLQEEIIRTTQDMTIFAWTRSGSLNGGPYLNFLADGPEDFAPCSNLRLTTNALIDEDEMSITNKGVHIKCRHWIARYRDGIIRYALVLKCGKADTQNVPMFVPMRKAGPNMFVRVDNINQLDPASLEITHICKKPPSALTLLTRLPREQLMSESLIVSSRSSAVTVEFPHDVPGLSIDGIPQKYWDVEEATFFSSDTTGKHWGFVSAEGQHLMFLCFWHNLGKAWEFQGTILNPDDPKMLELVYDLLAFADALNFSAAHVESVLGRYEVELGQQSTQVEDDGWRFQFSFTVNRADDHRVCRGPRFKVKISRDLIDEAAAESRPGSETGLEPRAGSDSHFLLDEQ